MDWTRCHLLPFEHGERKPVLIQRNGAKVPSGGRDQGKRTVGPSEASNIRRENVKHYRLLLEQVTDEADRQKILKLIAEEQQKQRDAGDDPT